MSEDTAGPEETPQLTEPYHKARRQLALLSGILLAWEYLGIRLGESDSGKASSGLFGTEITIENSNAVPSVILLLILYFAFRMIIEWNQCAMARRARVASRTDLGAAVALALAAIGAFVFQRMTDLRIADYFSALLIAGIVVGLIVAGGLYLLVRLALPGIKTPTPFKDFWWRYAVFLAPVIIGLSVLLYSGEQLYPDYNLGLAVGAAIFIAANLACLFGTRALKERFTSSVQE